MHSALRTSGLVNSLLVSSALLVFVSGCANLPGQFKLNAKPVVEESSAATLKFRTVENVTPVKHHHVIGVNGQKLLLMKENTQDSFRLPAGSHTIDITCHSRDTYNDSKFQHNYTVADGKASLAIDVSAGDSVCLKVSSALTNCAVIREAEPDYCS